MNRLFDAENDNPWNRRHRFDGDIDMTAMIDCTFLLLIFFMVCSTMQSRPDLDLPIALHSLGVNAQTAAVVTVLAGTPQQSPTILLGDGIGDEASLEDVRGYVADAVANGRRQIVIKAEGDVPHGFLEDVARQIVAVDGAQIFMGVGDAPGR